MAAGPTLQDAKLRFILRRTEASGDGDAARVIPFHRDAGEELVVVNVALNDDFWLTPF